MTEAHFRQLLTLTVIHAYRGGASDDLEVLLPQETLHAARGRRLLIRIEGGQLMVAFRAGVDGTPVVPVTGLLLRIGLRPRTASLATFTAPGAPLLSGCTRWTNGAGLASLGDPEPVQLVGRMFSHSLKSPARPLALRLRVPSGRLLSEELLGERDGRSAVSFDLASAPLGGFTIEEEDAGARLMTSGLHHPELARAGATGVVELLVPAETPAQPPAYTVRLPARSERLSYYVVARNHTAAELAQLRIDDLGAVGDGRPPLTFDAIQAGDFTQSEVPAALLAPPGARVVLFRSTAEVPRRQSARRGLQLSRNGDPLIPHLPPASADQPDSNLIVHVTK